MYKGIKNIVLERETPRRGDMILSVVMGEEKDEREPLSFPFLPLPDHRSGTATPPLQTLASVPFKWEELPGKPIPCTDIIVRPEPAKSLELPPCRTLEHASKITKMPSPTTVLDGPYNLARPRFSSFRLLINDNSSSSCASPPSSVDICPGKTKKKKKKSWYFGRSLRIKNGGKEVADRGSFGISPYCDTADNLKMRRNGSFSGLSKPATTHLWVTLRETLKKAVPWKSGRKSKKEAYLK